MLGWEPSDGSMGWIWLTAPIFHGLKLCPFGGGVLWKSCDSVVTQDFSGILTSCLWEAIKYTAARRKESTRKPSFHQSVCIPLHKQNHKNSS